MANNCSVTLEAILHSVVWSAVLCDGIQEIVEQIEQISPQPNDKCIGFFFV